MQTLLRRHVVTAVLIAALGLVVACGDDDGPTGTGNDTTPPTLASVSATDANHISIRFSETVDRESAEDENNYSLEATTGGNPLAVANASLMSDSRTVTITTGTAMTTTGYTVSVDNVEDMRGNAIDTAVEKNFNGSVTPDDTPPQIVLRDPTQNETGVSRTEPLQISFSEPVQSATFTSALTLSYGIFEVSVTVTTEDDVHFTIQPNSPLLDNTLYEVSLAGVADPANNVMNDVQWTFKTVTSNDHTAPTLVSSVPANHATNVASSSTIAMTFSEPIDSMSFNPGFNPAIGDPAPVWTNGGKTVTFTPVGGLETYQQYGVTILPGGISDESGNANTATITLTFTTGATLQAVTPTDVDRLLHTRRIESARILREVR